MASAFRNDHSWASLGLEEVIQDGYNRGILLGGRRCVNENSKASKHWRGSSKSGDSGGSWVPSRLQE